MTEDAITESHENDNGTVKLGTVGYWPLKFDLWVDRFSDMWRVTLSRSTKTDKTDRGAVSAQLYDNGAIRVRTSRTIGQREKAHDYRIPKGEIND